MAKQTAVSNDGKVSVDIPRFPDEDKNSASAFLPFSPKVPVPELKVLSGSITQIRAPRPGDAGFDIASLETVVIPSEAMKVINTGLMLEIPAGHVGLLRDRSSLAKKGLMILGGVIDSSYRGLIQVMVYNTAKNSRAIQAYEYFAQLLIVPCVTPEIVPVAELSETERGGAGFGSTG